MRKIRILTTILAAALFVTILSANAVNVPDADFNATLQALNLNKGICVILGQSEVVTSEYIMNLASNSELIFYFQSAEEDEVRSVRELAEADGLLGSSVFVAAGSTNQVHITKNLADIVIATEEYEESEVLRILNPAGQGFVGGEKIEKSAPVGYDSWDHPRHGPDNNLLSEDTTIKEPYQTQFIATPRYAPGLQVTVSANGRIFKAFGSYAVHRRDEKYLNMLMCFNAYNGTTLWQQNLPAGYAVHRNTMVATQDFLYLGADDSCHILDASTGDLVRKIEIDSSITENQSCKWLAMEDGVLYLLLGEIDKRDNVLRRRSEEHGHVKGWTPFYNGHNGDWGHGDTLLAFDTTTTNILWHHNEPAGIDGRAIALKNDKIYFSRFGEYITYLNVEDGSVGSWRTDPTNAPEMFEAFARKDTTSLIIRWDSNTYLTATDEVLLFSGATFFTDLIAVSTEDGSLLWSYSGGGAKIIFRDNELYVFPTVKNKVDSNAIKLNLLTGEELDPLDFRNMNCVVTTSTSDSFFARTDWGSTKRYNVQTGESEFLTTMRPSCSEGVHASEGHLYWWPTFCDCTSALYGIISLASRSTESNFTGNCTLTQTSEINNVNQNHIADSLDWPTLRKNNKRTSRTNASVPEAAKQVWEYQINGNAMPTAPSIVSNTVFLGADNGVVYALDTNTGEEKWKAYTGGPINYPPSFWEGRVFVGSGDGQIYCFRALDGELLWKSLLAPNQNRIRVYDNLQSHWPLASGVLVENGIAYVAAGLTDNDGVFVFALDARTGVVEWENLTSGEIEKNAGVSVMGHLLSSENKLYLAGGMTISPAVYDMSDGELEYTPGSLFGTNKKGLKSSELYLDNNGNVNPMGPTLYSDPNSASLSQNIRRRFKFNTDDKQYVWLDDYMLICFNEDAVLEESGKLCFLKEKQVIDTEHEVYQDRIWNYRFHNGGYDEGGYGPGRSPSGARHGKALVISTNALIFTEEDEKKEGEVYSSDFWVVALDPNNGQLFWRHDLSSRPVSWGLAVDRTGNTILSLRDGKIICFGGNDNRILTNPSDISIPEGGTNTLGVKLSAQPPQTVTVSVVRVSGGDDDITVEDGATLTFTTNDWGSWQHATLQAAEDADWLDGSATIRCSAVEMSDANVVATEIDNDEDARYALPWTETFEVEPIGMAGGLGAVNNQHGWVADAGAIVTNSQAQAGSQALSVTEARALHTFIGAPTNVWITLWAQPVPGSAPETVPTGASAVFYVSTNNLLVAYDSTNATEVAGATISNGWNKIEVFCDYSSKVWNLSLNDVPTIGNFAFYGSPANFQGLEISEGSTNTAFFDSLEITDSLDDTDSDGLPDSWEEEHFGGDVEPDATASNGLNTVLQCYIAGLNPTSSASFFTVNSIGPLQWNAVSGRVYTIYWASNLVDGFGAPWKTNLVDGIYTDTTHTAESKGFYKIEVEME